MQVPRLSIITPSYNQAEYLERTIESVLSQRPDEVEYFIMDGGSTDGSADIVRKHGTRLTYWQSQRDGGQPNALNSALARCTGDVIAYINSDDWYEEGAFATVLRQFADDPTLDWVIGGCSYHDAETGEATVEHAKIPNDPARWVAEGLRIAQPAAFWSRRMMEAVGPFRTDMQYAFDTEHAIRCLFAGYRPRLIPDLLAHRWLHGDCKTVAYPAEFVKNIDQWIPLYLPRLTVPQRHAVRTMRLRREILYAEQEPQRTRWASLVGRLVLRSPRSAYHYFRSRAKQ
jgi:glycosyltransferase involved in cell wall biosynthesis